MNSNTKLGNKTHIRGRGRICASYIIIKWAIEICISLSLAVLVECVCMLIIYHQVLCAIGSMTLTGLESLGCLSLIPLPFHFNFFTYILM